MNWWYDWNIDQSSSRDLEYVAIRQHQYWPGLGQNWQSLGINTVLGYNEPDQANQANLTTSQALSSWGDLLGTGLRVGSPATSDGGPNTWLIPFVSQADAAGLRVDFAAIHYYQSHNPADPSGCASQMYSFLLNIWNNTHRPIWVTEWNNGANWTDSQYPVPTYAQQQACVSAMINMLESTPFVERYALYNWVEDGRSLVNSSSIVTPAGTTYSNLVSTLSYSQAMPDNGTRGIAEFLFATNTLGHLRLLQQWHGHRRAGLHHRPQQPGAGHRLGRREQLRPASRQHRHKAAPSLSPRGFIGTAVRPGSAFSISATVSTSQGGTPSQYMFLTPSSGSGTLRFAINSGSGEQVLESSGALASGSWQHVAVTLSNNVAMLYVNGAQVASSTSFSITPVGFQPNQKLSRQKPVLCRPVVQRKIG